jgi:hypothetical protein
MPVGKDGIRGCHFYPTCKFGQEELGGFLDRGPRNVGVLRIVTHAETGEVVARQDWRACYVVMKELERNREQEETGCVTEVIAQVTLVTREEVIKVPRYPRPGEPGSAISPQSISTKKAIEDAARRRAAKNLERLKEKTVHVSKHAPGT